MELTEYEKRYILEHIEKDFNYLKYDLYNGGYNENKVNTTYDIVTKLDVLRKKLKGEEE